MGRFYSGARYMEHKKAVFFDIDNTIWNYKNEIPDSTAAAIRALRENGHQAFICSGRTRGFIRHPGLLALGFDGIVSGCGTMLEYGGETLFYHRISPDDAVFAVETVRRFGFRPILEGREYLYFDDADFAGDWYGEKLRRDLGPRLRPIAAHWGEWEMSKFSCDTGGCDQAGGIAALAPLFDPIVHNASVVELVPKGFDKGGGVLRLCELAGFDPANTVCFGDGANDLGMFAVCGQSVCMGDGYDVARAAADLVTSPMMEDGVWNGCKTLGLI